MKQCSSGKYGTGLYYKACLYDKAPEWILGGVPEGNGMLISAICINKATKQVDIVIDSNSNSSRLLQKALIQVGLGFNKLNIPYKEQAVYQIFFQSTTGTQIIPTINKFRKKTFLNILSAFFKRR